MVSLRLQGCLQTDQNLFRSLSYSAAHSTKGLPRDDEKERVGGGVDGV